MVDTPEQEVRALARRVDLAETCLGDYPYLEREDIVQALRYANHAKPENGGRS